MMRLYFTTTLTTKLNRRNYITYNLHINKKKNLKYILYTFPYSPSKAFSLILYISLSTFSEYPSAYLQAFSYLFASFHSLIQSDCLIASHPISLCQSLSIGVSCVLSSSICLYECLCVTMLLNVLYKC